jgi:hypothetical protein
MKQRVCKECGKKLIKDEVALSQKMLGREITSFYCVNCLATELDCEPEDLAIKIQEFKEQGCALFL